VTDLSIWRKEAQELLVPVAGPALGDQLTGGDVQGGVQGGGAVADFVMGHPSP